MVAPAYLQVYGAYGIELQPTFSSTRIAWLERGGVFAVLSSARRRMVRRSVASSRNDRDQTPYLARDLSHAAAGSSIISTPRRRISPAKERAPAHHDWRGHHNAAPTVRGRPGRRGRQQCLRAEFTPNGPPNIPEFGTVTNETGLPDALRDGCLPARSCRERHIPP